MRHWEDFTPGEVTEIGPVTVSEDEIVEFARRYDPQSFHVDPAAAEDGPFGGLIASGWHTAALFMGMFVRAILLDTASLGSPGIDELRWLAPVRPGDTLTGRVTVDGAPVRPGDTLTGRVTVDEVRESSKDPHRGTVFTTSEVFNQDGTLVMRIRARGFFARRDPA